MPRKTVFIPCSDADRQELLHLASANRSNDSRIAERARIILACLDTQSPDDIAHALHISRSTVIRWRSRFMHSGLIGLLDKPRSGKPPVYDAEFEQLVLSTLRQPPPDGLSGWNGSALAHAVSASGDAVWRVLRKHGIVLARQRVWRIDIRLQPVKSGRDIIGVFISPPIWIVADCTPPRGAPGRIVTHDRRVNDALTLAMQEKNDLTIEEMLAIVGSIPLEGLTEAQRISRAHSFLNLMASHCTPGCTVRMLILTSSLPSGLSAWTATHPDIQTQVFSVPDEAIRRVNELFAPYDEAARRRLLELGLNYPANASPLVFTKVKKATQG